MTDFFLTRMGQIFYEGTMPKIARNLERIANALEKQNSNLLALSPKEMEEIAKADSIEKPHGPYFNHSRSDGPFEPCPVCLEQMSREQLLALAKDRREIDKDG